MGNRERVHGDATDDAAVLAALRDVLTRTETKKARTGSMNAQRAAALTCNRARHASKMQMLSRSTLNTCCCK